MGRFKICLLTLLCPDFYILLRCLEGVNWLIFQSFHDLEESEFVQDWLSRTMLDMMQQVVIRSLSSNDGNGNENVNCKKKRFGKWWLFIIINLARPRRIIRRTLELLINSYHLCTFHPQSSELKTQFNSIELKQKIAYTGACHAVIQLFRNCQCPAKDEELFLLHQSPRVALFCCRFWGWLGSHFVSLGDLSTKWRCCCCCRHACDRHAHL